MVLGHLDSARYLSGILYFVVCLFVWLCGFFGVLFLVFFVCFLISPENG